MILGEKPAAELMIFPKIALRLLRFITCSALKAALKARIAFSWLARTGSEPFKSALYCGLIESKISDQVALRASKHCRDFCGFSIVSRMIVSIFSESTLYW